MPLPMYPTKEPPSTIKFTVAIAAGKGGVGKSSVTVNLAQTLQQMGYAVGIMDMDIYGPSVRKMLPEDSPPSQKGEMITPAVSRGIKIISMAYFRKSGEASAVRAPIANGIVTQFIERVAWGHLDYLLIDFPPGTGDVQLTTSQKLNITGAVMVTTPQEVALIDVRKAIHLFDQVKVPIVGIVENMSYYSAEEKVYIFGKGGGKRLAQEIGAPFLGEIPLDPQICACGDKGIPLPNENVAYKELTTAFVDHITTLTSEYEGCLSEFELIWKEMDETSLGAPDLATK